MTGARTSKLSLQAIAESVTSWGREAIDTTKNIVETHYNKSNGFPRNSLVLYGDTDSVMVDFGIRAPCSKELLESMRSPLIKFLTEKVFSGSSDTAKAECECERIVSAAIANPLFSRTTDDEKSIDTDVYRESIRHIKLLCNVAHELNPAIPLEALEAEISKAAVFLQNSKGSDLGKAACKLITGKIDRYPMAIEWEKNYLPWIISTKKRYAGHKYAANPSTGVIEDLGVAVTGLENKRRDNCALTRTAMETVQNDVLILRDRELAVQHIRDTLEGVRTLRFSMDNFVITKSLSKKPKSYTKPMAQEALVNRIKKRQDAMGAAYIGTSAEFHLGDRVPYVVRASGPKDKIRDKTEDPLYAALSDIPLDIQYYTEKMLVKPLTRFCELFVDNPESVNLLFDPTVPIKFALNGTRPNGLVATPQNSAILRVDKGNPSTAIGAIGRFLVRTGMPCLNCKRIIPCNKIDPVTHAPNAPALCQLDIEDCCSKIPGLTEKIQQTITQELQSFKTKEREACRRCEGKVGDSVDACGNAECPNIYIRIKAAKDAKNCEDKLRRFKLL